MSDTVQASDGTALPLDSLPQAFTYTGSNLTAITVNYRSNTYVRTLTYAGSNITAISEWILQ